MTRTAQYTNGGYLEKVRDWHVGDAPWKAEKVWRMLQKHELSPVSIADVGCGVGGVLAELQKKMPPGTWFSGYDISPQAIDMARLNENHELKFYNRDFFSPDAPPHDLTLLLDVFEHVPDYLGFLTKMRQKSKWILFHIPLDLCARELVRSSRYPLYMRRQYGHLHYFTRETALATLEDTGFRIVDFNYTDDMEMEDAPPGLKPRLTRGLRQGLFRHRPGLAAAIYSHFNLLVFARGDLAP